MEKNDSPYKIISEEVKPNSIQRLKYWYWSRSICLNALFTPGSIYCHEAGEDTGRERLCSNLCLNFTQVRLSLKLMVLSIWETTSAVPSGFFQFKNKTSTFCGMTEVAFKCRFRFLSQLYNHTAGERAWLYWAKWRN